MKIIGTMLLSFMSGVACAEGGYVHGKDHCYHFSAPDGWELDNVSGKSHGVPMVLYPKDSSWADARTVIYSRVADFVQGAKTPQEKIKGQVNRVLDEFKKSGDGLALKAAFVGTVKSKNGTNGEIWKFSGDKWGNLELVAYFVGTNTVNFFVLSARDAKDFKRSSSALLELASSYREENDCVPCASENITLSCSGKK